MIKVLISQKPVSSRPITCDQAIFFPLAKKKKKKKPDRRLAVLLTPIFGRKTRKIHLTSYGKTCPLDSVWVKACLWCIVLMYMYSCKTLNAMVNCSVSNHGKSKVLVVAYRKWLPKGGFFCEEVPTHRPFEREFIACTGCFKSLCPWI